MRPKDIIKKELHRRVAKLFIEASNDIQEATSADADSDDTEYEVYLRLGKLRIDVKRTISDALDTPDTPDTKKTLECLVDELGCLRESWEGGDQQEAIDDANAIICEIERGRQ